MSDEERMAEAENVLYRWRDPSPADVGRVFDFSGQHVKNLCRALGLPMMDKSKPGAQRPSWTIPRETFRALWRRFHAVRDWSGGGAVGNNRN